MCDRGLPVMEAMAAAVTGIEVVTLTRSAEEQADSGGMADCESRVE